jgi:hypothetical protein
MSATQTMDLFTLGRRARERRHRDVSVRADGAVWMALGAQGRNAVELGRLPQHITEVHYHPHRDDSPEAAFERVVQLREEFPGVPVHGFSPGWLRKHGLTDVPADSLCFFTGELSGAVSPAACGWETLLHIPVDKVAVVVYGPEHTPAQLESRIAKLNEATHLTQLVLLPRAVGDLVVVPGATTDGTRDVEFLALARAVLHPTVRLRASWGTLGFKLAQCSLAFGADALAGWGLDEHLAYSGKMRSAEVVGWDEARAGVAEARLEVHE